MTKIKVGDVVSPDKQYIIYSKQTGYYGRRQSKESVESAINTWINFNEMYEVFEITPVKIEEGIFQEVVTTTRKVII